VVSVTPTFDAVLAAPPPFVVPVLPSPPEAPPPDDGPPPPAEPPEPEPPPEFTEPAGPNAVPPDPALALGTTCPGATPACCCAWTNSELDSRVPHAVSSSVEPAAAMCSSRRRVLTTSSLAPQCGPACRAAAPSRVRLRTTRV